MGIPLKLGQTDRQTDRQMINMSSILHDPVTFLEAGTDDKHVLYPA